MKYIYDIRPTKEQRVVKMGIAFDKQFKNPDRIIDLRPKVKWADKDDYKQLINNLTISANKHTL